MLRKQAFSDVLPGKALGRKPDSSAISVDFTLRPLRFKTFYAAAKILKRTARRGVRRGRRDNPLEATSPDFAQSTHLKPES